MSNPLFPKVSDINLENLSSETNVLKQHIEQADASVRNAVSQVGPEKISAESLAEKREISGLAGRISQRLVDQGIITDNWKQANSAERVNMLKKAFEIMTEEMQIPETVRKTIKFTVDGNTDAVLHEHAYKFKRGADGALSADDGCFIQLHSDILYDDDFDRAIGGLMHQSSMLMEICCCEEGAGSFLDSAKLAAWTREYKEYQRTWEMAYEFASPIQEYARHTRNVLLDKLHQAEMLDRFKRRVDLIHDLTSE